ncbi:MAG: ORF6C domain-containing protein [Anaerolineae bacterium]|nr:ORF6C domain-containing protein [Anaerolineae bacterium]MCO5206211.1 ORF6C domain-containing protein [Anaerolineae bacterium]
MAEKALAPLEQKQVVFYDDEIIAVLLEERGEREVYVPIRQICDLLGVSYQGQIRRINDDPVLSQKVKGVNVTFTPSGSRGGGMQIANCLSLNYLNGWLFSINAKRVKPEVRDRLIVYQEKCYQVLAEAFRENRLSVDTDFDELLQTSESDAAQAYRMLQALVKLARNQVLMEAQLEKQVRRLDEHDRQLTLYSDRLEEIEVTLGAPERQITPDQAMQISQAVMAVAHELGRRSGRNEYGGVYSELYRRYSVNSYKALPANKFDAALSWLNQWLQMLTGEDDVAF